MIREKIIIGEEQADDAQRAIHKAVLHIGQTQATFFNCSLQEERHNLRQQAFRQAEKQDEKQGCKEVRFRKKDLQSRSKRTHDPL